MELCHQPLAIPQVGPEPLPRNVPAPVAVHPEERLGVGSHAPDRMGAGQYPRHRHGHMDVGLFLACLAHPRWLHVPQPVDQAVAHQGADPARFERREVPLPCAGNHRWLPVDLCRWLFPARHPTIFLCRHRLWLLQCPLDSIHQHFLQHP